MGIAEIAEEAKVSRPRARQLADRADFPQPIAKLRMGPVWEAAPVKKWIRNYRSLGSSVIALLALALLVLGSTAAAHAASPAKSVEDVATNELRAVRGGFEGTTGAAHGTSYTFAPTFSTASCGVGRPWRLTRVCVLKVRAAGTPSQEGAPIVTVSVWERLAITRQLDIVRRVSKLCSSVAPCSITRFP